MIQKKCVAMLLAGGAGKRLGILTRDMAKPAVPFGGKYRIIDFTLSNCTNSGIYAAGVLTQYQPLILNSHIGTGIPWDLDRKNGGVSILPPYVQQGEKGKWYEGTANAIFQNIYFIERYNPEYVLVISGDHIYKMDYSLMLEYHEEKGADATIAVIEVPWGEANRFGIMNTGEDGSIIEFEEKPSKPKNNLASMGVYIFTWPVLKKYLYKDNDNPKSSSDFGKDIIPLMLKENSRLYAYPFRGYWKDVGTIESLWEANMDLLSDQPELDLYDRNWRIYSVNPNRPPHFMGPSAHVHHSMVNEGCMILGTIHHSVLFTGVYVGEGSEIKDSIIMSNVKIGSNVKIERAIIGEGAVIEDHCQIASDAKNPEIILLKGEITIPENSIVKSTIVSLRDLQVNREEQSLA